MDLVKRYEITQAEAAFCTFIRTLRGKGGTRCPKIIYTYSKHRYGMKGNVPRYWMEKYKGMSIGKYTQGYQFVNSICVKSIGAFSSIAEGQACVPFHGHKMDWVTTFTAPGVVSYPDLTEYEHSIEIGNDVWIGNGAMISDHVKIGDGAVIGARSMISEDVPPYAVVVGRNRLIRYRFPKEIIEKLLIMKWWDWDDEKIMESRALFHDPIKFVDKYGL